MRAVLADDGAHYLLSQQVLLDLCGTQANPAIAWSGSAATSRLRLSVITVALARSAISRADPGPDRHRLEARLTDLLAQLRADGGEPLPFGEGAAAAWQSYVFEPSLNGMAQLDRQFYAVARHAGLWVVEYRHAFSGALGPLGVKVHDLGPRA